MIDFLTVSEYWISKGRAIWTPATSVWKTVEASGGIY